MTQIKKIDESSSLATPWVERTKNVRTFIPKVDIYETKDAVVLLADMPGADEKTVDVTVEKDVLSISASTAPILREDSRPVYSEFSLGDYHRSFTISEEIDRDRIEASLKNGVLRLTLPKAEKATVKKISIKTL